MGDFYFSNTINWSMKELKGGENIDSKNGENKESYYIKDNLNFTLLEWYTLGKDMKFIISRETIGRK